MATLEGDASTAIDAAWAQVAELTPQLAPQVDVVQHRYRGETWFVLADRMTGSHFRCTPAVQQFLTLLDGEHSLAEAYATCAGSTGDESIDRGDVLRVLTALQSSQLLYGGAPLDSTEMYKRQRQLRRSRWLRRLASPLALQIPLVDPDAFLVRTLPWVKPLFNRLCLGLWLLIVAMAALGALGQWSGLSTHWEARFLDPGNLLYLWLLYPLVKGLHELGHGYATRVWGGEVHEMGVMLLVFTPVPYVDASTSSAFPSRYQRAAVAAAGIMVELLLAAVALLIWSYSNPGLLRDLCFNVMVIGGLSTLLFNGNPLLRFDGYYVLTDLLEIPNLRDRANRYLGYLLKRHALNLQAEIALPGSGRERGWLLFYAIAAGGYRLLISLTIALFVAGKYFFIGVSLALWLIISQLALPLYRMFSGLIVQARRQGRLGRLCAVTGTAATVLILGLFVVPASDSTHAEGVVNLPENAQIRMRSDGFIEEIFKHNGQRVVAGEPLLQLRNPELVESVAVLQAKYDELAIRHSRALSGEPVDVQILKLEMDTLQGEIHQLQEELASLLVVSPHEGIFALPRAVDLPGRFVHKGDLLGHVINHSAITVRVVVSQAIVDRVRRRTETVEVRLASSIEQVLVTRELQQVPQATTQLPSALLGSRAGGDIAVDARDQEGRQAISSVFQLDVTLPAMPEGTFLGQRAFVRFVYQREPLAIGWYRQFRQLLMARFSI